MAKTTKSTNIQTKKPTQKATKKTPKTKGIKITDTEIKVSDVNDELNEFEAMLDETLAEVEKKKAKTELKVLNKTENTVEKVAEETATVEKAVEEVSQTEEKAENSTEVETTTKTGTEVIKKAEEVIAKKEVEQVFSIGVETGEEKSKLDSKTQVLKKKTLLDICRQARDYLDIEHTKNGRKSLSKDAIALNAFKSMSVDSNEYKNRKVFWTDKIVRLKDKHYWYATPKEFVERYNNVNPRGQYLYPVCPICQAREELEKRKGAVTDDEFKEYLVHKVVDEVENKEGVTVEDLLINKFITEVYYRNVKTNADVNMFVEAGFRFDFDEKIKPNALGNVLNPTKEADNNAILSCDDTPEHREYMIDLTRYRQKLKHAEEEKDYLDNIIASFDKRIVDLDEDIRDAERKLKEAQEYLKEAKNNKREKESALRKDRSKYTKERGVSIQAINRLTKQIDDLKLNYSSRV